MASALITTRQTKSGPRYIARYRLGGRAYPLMHGGAFRTLKEARARRDLIAGELAAGRNPADLLGAMTQAPPVALIYRDAQKQMIAGRVDVDENTKTGYECRGRLLVELIGDRPVEKLTDADARELVAALAAHKTRGGTMAPSSVRSYFGQARQVLDHARIRPNPFRDELVKMPREERDEPSPPTAREVLAILDKIPRRYVEPLALLDQCGMRVGELRFTWGDVDTAESRIRLRRTATKTNRPRWVQVPRWLMDALEELCPLEDRTAERPVFAWTGNGGVLRVAMGRACRTAGIALYSPHDLRHRRISLWHGQGIPWKEIADRVGHAKPSETLDTYSHVMPLEEVGEELWSAALVWSR
jgi:integrase